MVARQLDNIAFGIEQRITALRQELESLHEQRDAIDARMRDIEKHLAIWQEAWKMELPESDDRRTMVPNGNSRLLSMPISEAVDHLRRQNMGMTKELARMHLEAIGYDFKGKRPGAVIHLAWVNSERRKTSRNGHK